MSREIEALTKQRDELLAVLEFYADPQNFIFWDNKFCEFSSSDEEETNYAFLGNKARAAIAAAKAGAS